MFKFYLVLALKTLVCDLTWKSFRVTLAGTFPSFLGAFFVFWEVFQVFFRRCSGSWVVSGFFYVPGCYGAPKNITSQ